MPSILAGTALIGGADFAAIVVALGADEARKGIERQSKNPKTMLGIFLAGRFVSFG
jgi:hypothetical protein